MVKDRPTERQSCQTGMHCLCWRAVAPLREADLAAAAHVVTLILACEALDYSCLPDRGEGGLLSWRLDTCTVQNKRYRYNLRAFYCVYNIL